MEKISYNKKIQNKSFNNLTQINLWLSELDHEIEVINVETDYFSTGRRSGYVLWYYDDVNKQI